MKQDFLKKVALPVGAVCSLAFLAGLPANAGPGAARVTAQSNYGNGSATGAVRRTSFGHQVQLPSGFWEDCERDCREALRRQHLDFWETLDEEGPNGRK